VAEIDRFIANLNRRPPATDEEIAAFERTTAKRLSRDYVEFLKATDGGEGYVGEAYVILWGAGELVAMNNGYEVETYAPGLLIFGSDGGGEAYGFDTRVPQWSIVEIPFVGMEWSVARPIGPSFLEFLEHLLRGT
jgi:SMI1 / KNR4 family (SUKH-1)